jgi:alkylation response protein AidB-like acyl-CoA dehydrogenase
MILLYGKRLKEYRALKTKAYQLELATKVARLSLEQLATVPQPHRGNQIAMATAFAAEAALAAMDEVLKNPQK